VFEEVGAGASPAELKMPLLFHCVIVAMIVIIIFHAIDHAPSEETRTRTRPRTPHDGEHR
jgi:Na+-transporting NADH:ubiquinone oxidoreductase subunit NqrB